MQAARFRSLVTALLAGAALAVPLCAHAQSEQPTEFESWQLPGWTFTPGVTVGWLYDSNVAVAYPPVDTGKTAADNLFQMEPFGLLEFYGPRTDFSSSYHGFLRRYSDFNELDSLENRASASLRHRITRRLTLSAGEAYLRTPTTDQVELNGVPFQRNGSRYDSAYGGLEFRVSRTITASARYEFTWVDFEKKDVLLNGGFVNGIHGDVTEAIGSRSSAGAEYTVRWADLDQGLRQLSFQNVGGVYRYRVGERTLFEASAGLAYLIDRFNDVSRTGPYVHAGLTHRLQRATLGASYDRSYVPSFAFGGSNQSEEVRGNVTMPLNHNRLYVDESAAWRRTNPLLTLEIPLNSIWIHTTVGYELVRWFRVEGYHAFTRQDTQLAAGQKINRNIIGVQFVVARPVRLQQ
ncbi:MAG TPA: hypothetical protein VL484_11280 [Vicinamibacterales bacterium]|jgi:hypothetical protein|nr:hypothetical protein [Vicinamibacterales bacterium]